jgi:putative DNA primase/helicase
MALALAAGVGLREEEGARMSPRHDIPHDLRESMGIDDIGAIGGIGAIPTTLPRAVSFPVDAMPTTCRKLIREASEAIGCAPEMIGLPMLAALGASIGNSRRLQVKRGWSEGSTIYACVVAEPGEKKSPAQSVAVAPIMSEQARLNKGYQEKLEEHAQNVREYEADKANARKDGVTAPAPPPEPKLGRVVVGDTTTEALAVMLQDNPRGVLVNRDELAGWVRGMDQYRPGGKGADRQYWLSAWRNEPVQIDRKTQAPVHLALPFSCVMGSIQPDVLPDLGSGREDGMLERFLFAYPEPRLSPWSDAEISDGATGEYAHLCNKLRALVPGEDEYGDPAPRTVGFTEEAREVFIEFYNRHYHERRIPGFPRNLKQAWPKLEGYLARLALILAVCRSVDEGTPERVEASDVFEAHVLITYFKNQAYRVFVRLYEENTDDLLLADLTLFLIGRGGSFEGSASELDSEFMSHHKPKGVQWLSKKIEELSATSPALTFERADVSAMSSNGKPTSRRVVRLTLENWSNYANCANGWRGGDG